VRAFTLGTNSRPIAAGYWSLVTNLMSLIRYINGCPIGCEKPYPETYHPTGEEIPNRVYTPGVRVPGFQGLFYKP